MGADATRAAVGAAWRRAGFGPTAAELDAGERLGTAGVLAGLLAPAGEDPGVAATPAPDLPLLSRPGTDTTARAAYRTQRAQQLRTLRLWWLDRMVVATQPLPEKVALAWHHHFATSVQKVLQPHWMLTQNEIFRTQGLSTFPSLLTAVAHDPAMLIWLDAIRDVLGGPNENFARECMELFTLGIGHYTETDVREAARAYTGWSFARQSGDFVVRPRRHDGGTKTVLGVTGPLTGDDVLAILVRRPECPTWVASRLALRTVGPRAVSDPLVTAAAHAAGSGIALRPMVSALLTGTPADGPPRLVRSPVEWVVGHLRTLGLRASDEALARPVLAALTGMGQSLFAPPSVGGWPAQTGWCSTAASLARLRLAGDLAIHADLSFVTDVPAAARVDALGSQLGVTWTPGTRAALTGVAARPAELVALGLCAPELLVV